MKKTFYDILNKIAKSQIDDEGPIVLQGACCQETWGGQVICTEFNYEIPANRDPQLYVAICEGPHPSPLENPAVNNNSPKRGIFTEGAFCADDDPNAPGPQVNCYEVLGMEEPGPSGPDRPEVDGESCTSICNRTMKDCIRQESIRVGCQSTQSADTLKRCFLDKYRACLAEKDPLIVEPPYQEPCDYYFARCDCDKAYISDMTDSYLRIRRCYRNKVGDCLEREDSCQKKLDNLDRSFVRTLDSFMEGDTGDGPNCDTYEQLCSDIDPTDLAAKCRNAKNAVRKITRDFDKSNNSALTECLASKDRNDHCGRCQCGKDHFQRKKNFDYQMCLHMHSLGCIDNAALARCEPDFTCFSRPEDCNGIRTKRDCKDCREEGGGQQPSGPMGPTRPGRPTTPRPTRPTRPTNPTGPRRNPRTETDG